MKWNQEASIVDRFDRLNSFKTYYINKKITATVITYNEEKNIARCLKSLQDIADEIVVVDSYSKDDTEAICRTFGVTFFQNSFAGHIQQKNYALDQAQHDIVLSLDADEVLSEALRVEIATLKNNWIGDAYQFNRLNNFCGQWIRHGLWYPDRKTRLWDRRMGRWGGINPHDKVILAPQAVLHRLKGDLLHFTVSTLDEFYQQQEKFSQIQAQGLKERGFKPWFFHHYIKPPIKFLTAYFLRMGFLDGKAGFEIAKGQAWQVRERYRKIGRIPERPEES